MGDVDRSDDGRYIVVDGRRWRATDPSIPEPLRKELVAELMDARRRVGLDRGDDAFVAAARRRVQDAKVALGERGEPWWDEPSPEGVRTRAEAAIRALVRKRGAESSICPSDAARIVGGDSWREIMEAVREVGRSMADADEVVVTQNGEPVDDVSSVRGPIRYAPGSGLS